MAIILISSDAQVGPIYDPEILGRLKPPLFVNPSAVDVYLDTDKPDNLNMTAPGVVPAFGTKLSANGGSILLPSGKKIFGRAVSNTMITLL